MYNIINYYSLYKRPHTAHILRSKNIESGTSIAHSQTYWIRLSGIIELLLFSILQRYLTLFIRLFSIFLYYIVRTESFLNYANNLSK